MDFGCSIFVLFQVYSYLYDEGETWAVWPNDVDLSEFSDGSGAAVIKLIFSQLFDGVRKIRNTLEDMMQNEKSLLTSKMNELLTAFEVYRADVQTNEIFVRYLFGETSYSD